MSGKHCCARSAERAPLGRLRWAVALGAVVAACASPAAPASAGGASVTPSGGDDTKTLQAALDEAPPGGIVRLGPGEFHVSGGLRIRTSGVRLLGAGRDATVVQGTAGSRSAPMIDIDGRSDIEIAHLALDGSGAAWATDGIKGFHSRQVRLHDLVVRDLAAPDILAGRSGITLGNVVEAEVARSVITDIGTRSQNAVGIGVLYGSRRTLIADNVVRRIGRNGITCALGPTDGSSETVIQRNTVTDIGTDSLAIELWRRCGDSVVEDNVVEPWISVVVSDRVALRRNVIAATGGRPSFAGIETAAGSDVILADNASDAGALHGLLIPTDAERPTEHVALLRNRFRGAAGTGGYIRGGGAGTRYVYVHGGGFTDTSAGRSLTDRLFSQGAALTLDNNVHHLTLDDVDLSRSHGNGLNVVGDGGSVDQISVVDSRIVGNRGRAVSAWSGYRDLEWRGNTVAGNRQDVQPASVGFPGRKPVVAIAAPASARVGSTVRLRSDAHDPDGTIRRLLWDLGTGVPRTEDAPAVVYQRPGRYSVSLVAWDDQGRGAIATTTIAVHPVRRKARKRAGARRRARPSRRHARTTR